MPRAVVIINPMSGRGRFDRELRADSLLASTVLGNEGFECAIRITNASGDAHRFALAAANDAVDLVVAWGGDGTMNETASALVRRGIPLGIVPFGSGNGLASDLRLPFGARQALTVAARGRNLVIDAGQIQDRLFFNIAGIGVDAVIAAKFAERGRRQRGPLGYLQIGVGELLRYRGARYEICTDQGRTEYHAMLLALANGRQYGNRVLIAPGARLDDGLLELVIVERLSTVHIARRLPSLFMGRLRAGGGVTMRAVRDLEIKSDQPIPFHVDGEPQLGPPEVSVKTIDRALTVRIAG